MIVHGAGPGGVRGGATVAARLDHRIAMSFLVLGLAARGPVTVDDARADRDVVSRLRRLMTALGADLRTSSRAAAE